MTKTKVQTTSPQRKPKRSSAEYERIRASYRPAKVKILLVGESRPHIGTFFYLGDPGLLSNTCNVFRRLTGRDFSSPGDFLNYFRDAGYFLDDLCLEPVNQLDRRRRNLALRERVSLLADRIKAYSPEAVICVMKGIEPYVRKAVEASGIHLKYGFHSLLFPAMGNQMRYQADLERILKELGNY